MIELLRVGRRKVAEWFLPNQTNDDHAYVAPEAGECIEVTTGHPVMEDLVEIAISGIEDDETFFIDHADLVNARSRGSRTDMRFAHQAILELIYENSSHVGIQMLQQAAHNAIGVTIDGETVSNSTLKSVFNAPRSA